jgi:GTP cyclohydrolase II
LVELPVATVRTQVKVPLRLPDGYATTATVFSFNGLVDGREHVAFGLGDWVGALDRSTAGGPAPLVRPHSECLTGDVFGSQRCDCGPQLREAVERIADAGGFLLYLRQEGRGEDERDYAAAAQMLFALGADRVRLLSNNPDKADQLDSCGVTIAERIPTGVHVSPSNVRYLATKASHTSHTLTLPFGD